MDHARNWIWKIANRRAGGRKMNSDIGVQYYACLVQIKGGLRNQSWKV